MSGPYQIIYADPPWQYKDKAAAGARGAAFKYPVMDLKALCAMRPQIDAWAAPDCLLAMWWTAPLVAEALQLVEAWGFKLKTMKGFTWYKTTKHGREHFGMGNWTRANTEDCLFAVRGKPRRVCAGVRQVITAPIREHSRKPDEARVRLVQLLGDVPRLELFARQAAPGWDSWGNQVDKFPVQEEKNFVQTLASNSAHSPTIESHQNDGMRKEKIALAPTL